MKQFLPLALLLTLLLATSLGLHAQLAIENGAQFTLAGNVQITLNNIDLVNNGGLSTGTGSILFTGKAVNKISGISNMVFYDLGMGKDSGWVQLQVPLKVSHQVTFTAGLLDLNGNNLDLGTTGSLSGELNSDHIIGSDGGFVLLTANLNAPNGADPGNLGISITSSKNLGATTIRRGHQPQTSSQITAGYSISRYYDIIPTLNTGLDATVRFTYLPSELNGLDASHLILYEEGADSNWVSLGYDTRDTAARFVQKIAVASLGRLTLSPVSTPLPVHFVTFTARCTGKTVSLNWETVDEENIAWYSVQRSTDGVAWDPIATVPAAANPGVVNDYSFEDNTATGSEYYRIAEYDRDGKYTLSRIVTTDCNTQEPINVWPNPVSDRLYIRLWVSDAGEAAVRMFDAKGSLVRQLSKRLSVGTNLLQLDVKGLAAGIYLVNIIHNDGQPLSQQIMIR
jgi:hypothetical protein